MKISSSRQHSQSVPQNYLEIPNCFTTRTDYFPPTKQLLDTQSTQFPNLCETTCTEDNKFRWKELMKLHIGSNNIETYQPYVNNLLYSSLDETEIQTLPENYIIHLVKLIQSIANIQTHKVNELTLLNKHLTEQLNELTSQRNTKRNNDELISTLKKQNKHQQQIINTYRTYLSRKTNSNTKHNESLIESDSNSNKSVTNSNNKDTYRKCNEEYYCMYCLGVCFYTKDSLEEHLRKIHLIHGYKVKENNKDEELQREKDAKAVELQIQETKQQIHNALVEKEILGYYQTLSSRIDCINANMHNKNMPTQYKQSYQMNVVGDTRYQPFVPREMNQNEINLYKTQIAKLQERIELEEQSRLRKVAQIEKDINEQKPFMKRNISSMRQSQGYNIFLKTFNEETIETTFRKHRYIHPYRKHKQLTNTNAAQHHSTINKIANVDKQYVSTTKDKNEHPLQQSTVNNINILPIEGSNDKDNQALNEENVSQISQTIEEKELETFYRKFKLRDGQYSKGISYYNVEIIPEYYSNTLNYNNINSRITDLLNNATPKKVCNTSILSYHNIHNLNSEKLQHLITDLYAELGTKSENVPCFGYYSKTMDNMFELRKTIEQHNSNKSKRIKESYNSQY